MNDHRMTTDALIIGSGIAGAVAALTLAEAGVETTILTAGEELTWGNTSLAQGGIVYTSEEDSPKSLEKDILTAGWNHNYIRAVRHLAQHGPEILKKVLIEKYPVPFSKTHDSWNLTKEGGHSIARILYCADHTGKNIMETLAEALNASPNIRILTSRTAIDLLTTGHHARHTDYQYSLNNQCVGAYVFNEENKSVETILARFTMLATGGVGQVFLHTTNTQSSIGSGLAMAQRAGAKLMNCEYIQFHPTALYGGAKRGERRFLVSEAVRGEGAKLVNGSGEAFMPKYDERADLAPRDIVTRAIMDEMLHSGADCVYLDVSNNVDCDIHERFPTISQNCANMGVDICSQPIPVVPAAHYFCGGVLTDINGRTTLDRLYAAGETSCTGVHGANRLASTSLLEGLVWGYGAANDIAKHLAHKKTILTRKLVDSIPDWQSPGNIENEDPALIAQDWATVRNTMWNYVGIARNKYRLNRAFADLRNLYKNLQDFYRKTPPSKPIIDLFHGSQCAYIITLAAMRNKQSKGCHFRVR
ncbi:L-aspartate oxidase [Pseudodesulfovibrio senegalensis]|jgi:L-aspartate oxidase|uniref:L-aspartate oxidase n=1 Tax=Pseudodesulfovibrio senegalensis TaxID=1721087 RepID=A0A6N6N295_9BACT|nr:L-aspartate oxidase [Pseudodesulfovibrio senegalensis]KAB1441120.1 L-aspartate oxidase [Pseudodesulfovibrio senegalensis]